MKRETVIPETKGDFFFQTDGVVYYSEKIALPENCTLTIELKTISHDGSPDNIFGRAQYEVTHQVPLEFSVMYSPDDRPVNGLNVLEARIEHEGQLLWRNDENFEFEKEEDPNDLKVQLFQARG